jgi:ribosomal-protein-alanine N-acetyltransferase
MFEFEHMTPSFHLETERTLVTLVHPILDRRLLDFSVRNRHHLQPWEAQHASAYYTLPDVRRRIKNMLSQYKLRTTLPLVALDSQNSRLIATCNVSQIIRGVFQAGYLGYSLDEEYQGQGYMTEILSAAIPAIFDHLILHRLMACYMPENERSGRLLERLGFVDEGLARDYLCINGQWRDHRLTALVNRDFSLHQADLI